MILSFWFSVFTDLFKDTECGLAKQNIIQGEKVKVQLKPIRNVKQIITEHKRAVKQTTYLHGNVGDGGRGQVKMLLHQNIQLGSEVPPSSDTVDFTGQNGGELQESTQERWPTEHSPLHSSPVLSLEWLFTMCMGWGWVGEECKSQPGELFHQWVASVTYIICLLYCKPGMMWAMSPPQHRQSLSS